MMKKLILSQVILFTIFIVSIFISNNFIKDYLLNANITSYNIHLGVKTISNCILALASFFTVKRFGLIKLSGLSKIKAKKLWLLIFPLFFLVLLNGLRLLSDPIQNHNLLNLLFLGIYCLSIGISEEISML